MPTTMKHTAELIKYGQSLTSACYTNSETAISTYDDGYGPLWISRNSIGINGIVRARTWEDAYSICEDELFPEADESMEEIVKEYGFKREHKKVVADSSVTVASNGLNAGERFERYPEDYPNGKLAPELIRWATIDTPDPDAWMENELFQEAFGFRNNGSNDRDTHKHGIYQKDLNGDSLDRLTSEMLEEIGITLTVESEYDVIVGNIGTIYTGSSEADARTIYADYVQTSIAGFGRAGNEPVTLMKDGEISEEHTPPDICLAGNPAVNGKCGDVDCVCFTGEKEN